MNCDVFSVAVIVVDTSSGVVFVPPASFAATRINNETFIIQHLAQAVLDPMIGY